MLIILKSEYVCAIVIYSVRHLQDRQVFCCINNDPFTIREVRYQLKIFFGCRSLYYDAAFTGQFRRYGVPGLNILHCHICCICFISLIYLFSFLYFVCYDFFFPAFILFSVSFRFNIPGYFRPGPFRSKTGISKVFIRCYYEGFLKRTYYH